MTPSTRRALGLLAVAATLAALLFVIRRAGPDPGAGPAPAGAAAAARGDGPIGDVNLDALAARTSEPLTLRRNLFEFDSGRGAGGASDDIDEPVDEPLFEPAIATGPPPPPPIPLRFIGYLDQAGGVPRVAVLSDGRGNVFNGREGDIIEGRYRLLRIGTDSADLIYVDGRGRQTIRLSGQ